MYMRAKQNKILVPEPLGPGDTIGIAAPASPFEAQKLKKGIDMLETMGFNVHVPEGLYSKSGYLAGSDIHRSFLLNDLFSNKDIKAVLCARGGFGSLKILPFLDYKNISANPKAFIGYSDVTAVLAALFKKSGLISFHGPMAAELGGASKKTKNAMFSALTSRVDFEITSGKGDCLKHGIASGFLIGGNLSTLCHLVGTPYLPDFAGGILFLEERGERAYRIDRMLTHMKTAGCFKGISGLLLGSFAGCGSQRAINKIVASLFEEFDIPILAGLPAGHGRPNITIPIGLTATLDAGEKLLSFKWKPAG